MKWFFAIMCGANLAAGLHPTFIPADAISIGCSAILALYTLIEMQPKK